MSVWREVRASMILSSDQEFPWIAWILGEMPWLDAEQVAS